MFLKKNYLHRHLFLTLFWLVLWFAVWIQVKQDMDAISALIHSSSVMICSISISQLLSDSILPKAIKTQKMKPFVFKAIFFVLILALLIGAVDAYFIIHSQVLSEEDRATLLFVQSYKAIPSSVLINGTACGIRFYQEHANIQRDHSQLQQNFLESQLKILQDQVNPHFMFNVLNHIHILMKKNVDMADFLLLKFSDILRYQLYECNQPFVLLSRELQYLQNFITIEQMRWGDELEVDCSWSQTTEDLHIAPLMLICFVENAFKHVDRLPNQKGKICVNCSEKDGYFQFHIRNSYQPYPLQTSTRHSGIGLENVKKRLELQYENLYTLTIDKRDDSFCVDLTINLNC
ncbi:MAG: sensor histidine kinase [Sphingobacterium sp.]